MEGKSSKMKFLMKQGRSGGSFGLPHWIGASLIILALMLCLLPQTAAAQGEVQPCRFFGAVKVNGVEVAADTVITAWIDDATGDWTTTTGSKEGQPASGYVVDIPYDDIKTIEKDGARVGNVVRFKVSYGGTDYQAAQTGVWQIGMFFEINLAVNTTTPVASLTGQPTGITNKRDADITVGGTGVVAYKYMLDDGAWGGETPVGTHIVLSGLTDGEHTVSVIGKDADDYWQLEEIPTTASWTVDTTIPVATLSGQPSGVVNYNTADIRVDGTGVVTYEYKLDAGDWSGETAVGAHIVLADLIDGQHTVYVVGKNALGTWQPYDDPSTATWTVDSTLAIATLSGQPTGTVNYNTADITVGGQNAVAYKYKLDDGAWVGETPVSTHIILSGLSDGQHTVSVIAKNALNHWQAESNATTASWTVDTTPPQATLSGQPTGTVNYSTADITAGGTDVVAYKYKLDNGTWSAETPVSTHIVLSGLSDGSHTVSVIGKSALGLWQAEADATTADWTVDTAVPPAPNLLSPTNEARTSDTTPTFDWSDVTDASGVSYSLQVDDNADFSSPIISKEGLTESTYTLTKDEALSKGTYYWRVKAVDGAGNTAGWTAPFSFTQKKGEAGGCGCGSGTKTSTSGLSIGLGIMGLCWGTGYYFVRRVSRRRNTKTR